MKKHFFLISLFNLLCFQISIGQYSQKSSEPFTYEANGFVRFNDVTVTNTGATPAINLNNTFKIPAAKIQFVKVNEIIHPTNNYKCILVQVVPITASYSRASKLKGLIPAKSYTDPLVNNLVYINSNDNPKTFWIKSEDFADLLSNEYVVKRYRKLFVPQFTYGGTLSIPFKLRPQLNDSVHLKITPEFTLGGYAGFKFRLMRYKPVFLDIVASAGSTFLGINDNNTIKETGQTKSNEDGLVLGFTRTIGAILDYNDFQIGIVAGRDSASGEIGSKWVYNNENWYSLSIGYAFLSKTTGK